MRRLISFGTMGLLAILLAFCSVVLAQDKLKQMFPDSEVVWERKLEKGIASFAVAKASGDIAAIYSENGYAALLRGSNETLYPRFSSRLTRRR